MHSLLFLHILGVTEKETHSETREHLILGTQQKVQDTLKNYNQQRNPELKYEAIMKQQSLLY